MGLSESAGATLINSFDLDENGEWSFQEFCDALKREDYTTYSEVSRDFQLLSRRGRVGQRMPALLAPTATQ
jgi:hypothetical protein